MPIIAMLVLWSACAGGGDSADSQPIPDLGLPRRLADNFPVQQGLDNAPVEKAPRQGDAARRSRDDDDDMIINVGAHARFTVPFGAANRNYSNNYYYGYYYVTSYTSWADVFNPGWGVELEADFFFGKNGPGHRRSPGYNYGIALLFQADQYYGKTLNEAGINLSMEDMTTTTLQIGGRYIQTLSTDFYYGGLVALGAVHYSQVDGTFSGPLVGVPTRDKIFRDTYTFASTFRMDGGYRAGAFGITLGAAFRIMAPPSEGTHMSMDSGAFWTFDIDLGVDIGF